MLIEILWTLGATLSIVLAIIKIVEKYFLLKEKYNKKPFLKVTIPEFGWGQRQRTQEEKENLIGFGHAKNFPSTIPELTMRMNLINNSKSEDVIDMGIYLETPNKKRINVRSFPNIKLEPMNPKRMEIKATLNYANEVMFWEVKNLELLNDQQLSDKFWSLTPKYLIIYIKDAHDRKLIIKETINNWI